MMSTTQRWSATMVDREELRQLVLGQFYMPMSPAKRRELRDGVLALLAERDQLRTEVERLRALLWNWCNEGYKFTCTELEISDAKLGALSGEEREA
jgi:hypothetical protein